MPAVTVFLAPDGPAAGVLDVLTDLSAADLVDPFLWVVGEDVSTERRIGGPVPAVLVDRGNRSSTTVDVELAETTHDRRRLCVVVPADGAGTPVGIDVEQRLRTLVENAGGGTAPTTPVRVVVSRLGDHAEPEILDRSGWHNIVLAAEEAYGPNKAGVALHRTDDPVEIGRRAAPVVAGLVGLWTGIDATPLDDDRTPTAVRMGRAFYRRIDATAVERELRARVLAPGVPLPRPHGDNVVADRADNAPALCHRMAFEWWGRHRQRMVEDPQPYRPPPPLPTGGWALLKLLLKFVWGRLRNAPQEWYQSLVVRGRVAAARRVHDAVLGADDGAYTVVVRGVDNRGLPADWHDLELASGRIDASLARQEGTGFAPRPDLRAVWDDFAGGAMALVDAGQHGPVAAVRAEGNPLVLRAVAEAVPPPDDVFRDVDGDVHPGDVLGTDALHMRLDHRSRQDPFQADEAGRTRQALTAWQARHGGTYTAQVGAVLATEWRATFGRIREYLHWLGQAAEADQPDPRTGRTATVISWVLGLIAIACIGTAIVLGTNGTLRPLPAILLGAVPPLAWLGWFVWTFLKEQREVFRLLVSRRELESRLDVVLSNLRQAVIDLRRLSDGYEQYLVWSRVLSAVLHDPFGGPPAPDAAGPAIVRGLPRTLRVARATVDEHGMGAATDALRQTLYRTGWIGNPWAEHLRRAGEQMGRHDLVGDAWPGLLDLRGLVAESPLARWADVLDERGTSPSIGDAAWTWLLGQLRTQRPDLAVGLLAAVQGVQTGDPVEDLTTFLADIDHQRPAPKQAFDAAHFTVAGLAAERGRIDVHQVLGARLGLSRVDVLVQLSVACPAWDFALTDRREVSVDRGKEPPPFPDRPDDDVDLPEVPTGGGVPEAPRGLT